MIINQIDEKLKEAMKNKSVLLLSTLRMLKSVLNYKKIEVQKELTDEDVIALIRSEIKKRQESVTVYEGAGRLELAEKEKQEVDILKVFLPAELSEDLVREKVKTVIANLPEEEKKNFGKVMAVVMAELKGQASGVTISRIVKEQLSN
ncbi:MAG: GatB/YqeY domain-containing protein [Patescibacteria group bacterium]